MLSSSSSTQMAAAQRSTLHARLDRHDAQIGELRVEVRELRTEVDQLRAEVNQLRGEVNQLRTEVNQLRTEVDELRAEVNQLRAEVNQLRAEVNALRAEVSELRGRVDDLERHMLVLHEDVIDRIAAIPDPTDAILREMRAGFADMREWVDRRLTPIELLLRQHDADIRDLKQSRPH